MTRQTGLVRLVLIKLPSQHPTLYALALRERRTGTLKFHFGQYVIYHIRSNRKTPANWEPCAFEYARGYSTVKLCRASISTC